MLMKPNNNNKNVVVSSQGAATADNADIVRPLRAARSLKACFFDGWRIFALNHLTYLKAFSDSALIAGIAATLLLVFPVRFVIEQFVRLLSLSPDAGTAACLSSLTNLDTPALCLHGGALVLSFLLFNVAKAATWSRIVGFDASGSLKGNKWRLQVKKTFSQFVRLLGYNTVVLLVMLLLLALAVWGCLKADHFYPLIIFLPVAYLMSLLFAAGRNAFMLGNLSFSPALLYSFTKGLRHYGGCLIISLLIGLPSLIVALIFLLPDVVFSAAYAAGRYSIEMGEEAVFPPSLVWIGAAVSILSFAIAYLSLTLNTWALAFKTASSFPAAGKTSKE